MAEMEHFLRTNGGDAIEADVAPLGDDDFLIEVERRRFGMGWLPDLPDFRDYTPEHAEVQRALEKMPLDDEDEVMALKGEPQAVAPTSFRPRPI